MEQVLEIYKNVNVERSTTRNGQNDTNNTHLSIVSSAVVKPCGLGGTYGRGGKELVVNHDDNLSGQSSPNSNVKWCMVPNTTQKRLILPLIYHRTQ